MDKKARSHMQQEVNQDEILPVMMFLQHYKLLRWRSFRDQFCKIPDYICKDLFGPGWRRAKVNPHPEVLGNILISPRRYFQFIHDNSSQFPLLNARIRSKDYFGFNVWDFEVFIKTVRRLTGVGMDKKIKKLQKETKTLLKDESNLLKADKKQDKIVDKAKNVVGKAKKFVKKKTAKKPVKKAKKK